MPRSPRAASNAAHDGNAASGAARPRTASKRERAGYGDAAGLAAGAIAQYRHWGGSGLACNAHSSARVAGRIPVGSSVSPTASWQ
jgi:hypothetical protein